MWVFSLVIVSCCAFALACVRLSRRISINSNSRTEVTQSATSDILQIDINRASQQELERLPGIGAGLASRIIEHRAQHGRFRRVEHLIVVRGISEQRFQQIRPFIKVE